MVDAPNPWYARAWFRRFVLAGIVVAVAGLRLLYPEVAAQAIDCVVWAFGALTLVETAYGTFLSGDAKQ